jgi:hypothetical protein
MSAEARATRKRRAVPLTKEGVFAPVRHLAVVSFSGRFGDANWSGDARRNKKLP